MRIETEGTPVRLGRARKVALLVLVVFIAGCSSTSALKKLPLKPVTEPTLSKAVTSDRITFDVPSDWLVISSTCRCPYDRPRAQIDSGLQVGGIECSCPMYSFNQPSTLNLYTGSSGLAPGGQPVVINGLRARLSVDRTTGSVSATFPELSDWISVSAVPTARTYFEVEAQVKLELRIVNSVRAATNGT